MKLSCINELTLSAVLAITGCVLGCGQSGQVGGSSSSAGSGGGGGAEDGGADAAPICLWGGSGGGFSFPVCPVDDVNEFEGTIDGKPYDTKATKSITGMGPPGSHGPYYLGINLQGWGLLELQWGDPYLRGQWMDITTGRVRLPEDTTFRNVNAGSKLLMDCNKYSFLYILHVDGGDLTGCSH
jgi:hypothetical protein